MATHGETRRAVGHGLSKHQGRPPVALDFYIENPFRPQGLTGFMFSEGDFSSAGSGGIVFYPGTGRIRMRNAEELRGNGDVPHTRGGGGRHRTRSPRNRWSPVPARRGLPRRNGTRQRRVPKRERRLRRLSRPRARERRNHAERPGECRPRASPRSALAPGRLPPPPRQLRRRGENSRRPVSASLAYAAFRRISGTSRSIFVIKMPYPVVGSLMSTWVTAPTNLPS